MQAVRTIRVPGPAVEGMGLARQAHRDGTSRRNPQILTTPVGLVLPTALSYEAWRDAGPKLFHIANSSAWCLGDWLVHGQDCFRDRYKRATEEVGLDYQTLRNYAWIARKFDHQRRRCTLSMQHHAEVASLPEHEQDRWLDLAEAGNWSRNELRRHIRDASQKECRTRSLTYLPRCRVSERELSGWQAAAAMVDTDFETWVIQSLNSAANQPQDRSEEN
jgi:hypothetical protein